jgi:hypothetical protein
MLDLLLRLRLGLILVIAVVFVRVGYLLLGLVVIWELFSAYVIFRE